MTHDMSALPTPTRLLADFLAAGPSGSPAVVGSIHPRLSFVPDDPGSAPPRNSSMSAYRIVVRNGSVAWDSGRVDAAEATSVRCPVGLQPGGIYNWTAVWWRSDGAGPSPAASSTFDVGLLSEADWAGAAWLGGGEQRELRFAVPRAVGAPIRRARLHVAAPGGVVVRLNGRAVGDPVGVSAWTRFDSRIVYQTRALEDALAAAGGEEATVLLQLGNGWWSGPTGAAASPAARVLLTLEDEDGVTRRFGSGVSSTAALRAEEAGSEAREGGTGAAAAAPPPREPVALARPLTAEGRRGPVLNDSVFLGSTIDWRLEPEAGWCAALRFTPTQP